MFNAGDSGGILVPGSKGRNAGTLEGQIAGASLSAKRARIFGGSPAKHPDSVCGLSTHGATL